MHFELALKTSRTNQCHSCSYLTFNQCMYVSLIQQIKLCIQVKTLSRLGLDPTLRKRLNLLSPFLHLDSITLPLRYMNKIKLQLKIKYVSTLQKLYCVRSPLRTFSCDKVAESVSCLPSTVSPGEWHTDRVLTVEPWPSVNLTSPTLYTETHLSLYATCLVATL